MKLAKIFFLTLNLLFFLLLSGCPLESLFPGQVADGVARLTVLNVGALMGALNLDKKCGFANQDLIEKAAKNPINKTGSPSGIFNYDVGEIEFSTKDCVLNFPEPTVISEDCPNKDGITDETVVQGKVTVTATQRRFGVLTGVDYQPVIPQGDTPISYEIQSAHFENFSAYFSNNPDQKMTFKDATLKASAHIHLAKDYKTQLCSEPVPNLTFKSIDFLNNTNSPAIAELPGPFGIFETKIAFAHLYDIQVGESFDLSTTPPSVKENTLNGFVQVWSSAINIPSDGFGLDPDYNRQAFRDSYICRENGIDPEEDPPVNFECNMDNFLFENTARLLTRNVGGVLKLDTLETTPEGMTANCGFQSKNPRNNTRTQIDGEKKFLIKMPTCQISENEVGAPTLLANGNCEAKSTALAPYSAECIANCEKSCASTKKSRCTNNCKNQFAPTSELISGGITSSGILIVDGNINKYLPGVTRTFPSPLNPLATLSNITFHKFSYFNSQQITKPQTDIKLTLFGGNTSAQVQPISTTVKGSGKPCEFKLVSPVVQFKSINFQETPNSNTSTNGINAELVINIPPPSDVDDDGCDLGPIDTSSYNNTSMKFEYNINSTDFSATNGFYLGKGNYINGEIKINEKSHQLNNIKLDPRFNQKLFDIDYTTCPDGEGNIANPIPPSASITETCEKT